MKSQSNSPKRTSKKSLQVNSQELEDILTAVRLHYEFTGIARFPKKKTMSVYEAKAKLLQLGLSCLPPRNISDDSSGLERDLIEYDRGTNSAIDTMEQNMRRAFS